MIEFDEKIVGVWYLVTTEAQDWLAAIRELEPDAKYELTYRFRYYKDHKIFDSDDTKNWYHGTLSGSRNYVVLNMRRIARELESRALGSAL